MKFFLTRNSEKWKEGVDHLLSDDIWLRIFKKKNKLIGELMCLNLFELKLFGTIFGLKHLSLDKHIKKKRDYLSVHSYKLWGKKLREVEKYFNENI